MSKKNPNSDIKYWNLDFIILENIYYLLAI